MRAAGASLGMILLSTVVLDGRAIAQTAADEITMYAGPGNRFPVVATVARDSTLDVRGCVEGYRWCDVAWQNNRGWVMAERVTYPFQDREASIRDLGDRLDIPVVGFSFGTYWDDFYSGRPWYGERERWQSMWRDQPEYLQFGKSARVNQTAGREFDNAIRQRELDLGPGQDNRDGVADRLGDRPGATDAGPGGQQGNGIASEADRTGPAGTVGTSGIQPGSPDATGSLGQAPTGGQSGVRSGGAGTGAGSSNSSGSGSSSNGSASSGSSSGGSSSGGGGSGGGGGGGGGG